MITVQSALHDLHTRSALQPAELKRAREQHPRVRQAVEGRLSVEKTLLSGSFKRHTAVHPLHDVDIFCVLRADTHGELLQRAPVETLDLLRGALDAAWPNKTTPRRQGRSVGLSFSGTGIDYDVVPAFHDPQQHGTYLIPDRDQGRWIRTNPEVHARLGQEANAASNSQLYPAVRAAKAWNELRGKPLRSFHLEVMAWEAMRGAGTQALDNLIQLFDGLSTRVTLPCPEPARLGPALSDGIPDPRKAERLLAEAAATLRRARDHANAGRSGEAHWLLREVFGGQLYPERGKAPVSAAAVDSRRRAVDDPNGRFG